MKIQITKTIRTKISTENALEYLRNNLKEVSEEILKSEDKLLTKGIEKHWWWASYDKTEISLKKLEKGIVIRANINLKAGVWWWLLFLIGLFFTGFLWLLMIVELFAHKYYIKEAVDRIFESTKNELELAA